MNEQLWWVRLPTGEEFGPISSSSLQRLIEKGMVAATDEIGEDPDKNWVKLKDSKFYPLLNRVPDFAQYEEPSPQEKTEEIKDSVSRTLADMGGKSEESKFGTAQVSVLKPGPKVTPRPSQPQFNQQTSTPPPKDTKVQSRITDTKSKPSGNTIELKPLTVIRTKFKKDLVIKIILGLVIAGCVYYLLLPEDETFSAETIHLVSPKENSKQLNDAQLDEILKKAKTAFESDTFAGYLFAMNQLVTSAESVTLKSETLSLLCLSYYQLWPFSYRDSEDLSAVTRVAQISAKVDPAGPNGGTCRVVQQILNGRLVESNGILDALLNDSPGAGQLYYLKARVLESQEDFKTAAAYAAKTEQLWPNWLRPYVKEAYYLYRGNQASDASNRLGEFIKQKPKHSGAKLVMGLVEYRGFKHADTAIELLKPTLSSGEKIESSLYAESAFALASAYNDKGDKNSAAEWGKKAYSLDPTLVGLKELLVLVTGKDHFEGLTNERENIALGDQYFMSSNFLAAQANYKAAYDADNKNATAAFKAGQALWKLNQGSEAIEWFKKAIQADSTKIEPYVALADVLSARYDFFAASAILQRAQKQAPKHYDVYRGFASLAFKRNDFNGAITNAKKALSLYDTDMASILLLTRSYLGSGQIQEAYTQAARAIELEKTNPEAQILYAEALAEADGTESAGAYLKNLVNTYPRVPEYGVALAKLHLRLQQNEQALDVIRKAVSVSPQNKKALLLQGDVLVATKKTEDALASYLAAAALDPSDGDPLFKAGKLYLDANQPLPAIAQYERVLSVNPNFPKVRLSIAQAALLYGDKERALKEIQEEKKINPSLPEPYILAGDIQMALQNYSKALMEFQAALKLKGQGADIYIRMARCNRLQGQHDTALSMLRAAETRESGNPEIAKEYGAVYELKGDNMGAVKFYNRYLQILPNAPDRQELVDRIHQLGGELE